RDAGGPSETILAHRHHHDKEREDREQHARRHREREDVYLGLCAIADTGPPNLDQPRSRFLTQLRLFNEVSSISAHASAIISNRFARSAKRRCQAKALNFPLAFNFPRCSFSTARLLSLILLPSSARTLTRI